MEKNKIIKNLTLAEILSKMLEFKLSAESMDNFESTYFNCFYYFYCKRLHISLDSIDSWLS